MRNTQSTQLIFELSRPGRRAARLPELDADVAAAGDDLPAHQSVDVEHERRYALLSAGQLYDEVQPQAE